ncbi:unnamed protein product [Psylliodes chrysocephalus]|uniref:THAP-type domain-containing protein n=1 Tax=Psylliodes chrysocephalus TaxID=3402493 RepID=A0A9P0G955_9CUCU|nr:unnamed protein product [Psylliodes chrysocephala]
MSNNTPRVLRSDSKKLAIEVKVVNNFDPKLSSSRLAETQDPSRKSERTPKSPTRESAGASAELLPSAEATISGESDIEETPEITQLQLTRELSAPEKPQLLLCVNCYNAQIENNIVLQLAQSYDNLQCDFIHRHSNHHIHCFICKKDSIMRPILFTREMLPKCCVPGCTSNYASSQEGYVTVFWFPVEVNKRELGLKNIPRKDWSPTKTSVVCIKHFKEDDLSRFEKYKDVSDTMDYDPLNKHSRPRTLNYIYTLEEHRRRGFAEKLLLHLKEREQFSAFCCNEESLYLHSATVLLITAIMAWSLNLLTKKHIKKYEAYQSTYKLAFKQTDDKSGGNLTTNKEHLLDVLQEGLNKAKNEAKYVPGDKIRITALNENFNNPVSTEVSTNVNFDKLLEQIENVVTSDNHVNISGTTFDIQILKTTRN